MTAILPAPVETLFSEPVPAGAAVLNGAGELTGFVLVSEWGRLETPVYLTSTHAVGRVYDGAVSVAVESDPAVGTEDFVIPWSVNATTAGSRRGASFRSKPRMCG